MIGWVQPLYAGRGRNFFTTATGSTNGPPALLVSAGLYIPTALMMLTIPETAAEPAE